MDGILETFHGIPWKVVTDIKNTWSDLCFDDVIMMSYPVPFCTFEDVIGSHVLKNSSLNQSQQ